jgi:hypothetical protein
MRVDLPKMRATPRQMAFHRVNREVEEGSDLDQRLVEHILQDEDTALEDGELHKARHCGFDCLLVHQHPQRVGLGRVGDVRGGVDRFGHAHLAAAQQVERAVMSDPEEPGRSGGASSRSCNATKARTSVSCTTSSPWMTDPMRRAQ